MRFVFENPLQCFIKTQPTYFLLFYLVYYMYFEYSENINNKYTSTVLLLFRIGILGGHSSITSFSYTRWIANRSEINILVFQTR